MATLRPTPPTGENSGSGNDSSPAPRGTVPGTSREGDTDSVVERLARAVLGECKGHERDDTEGDDHQADRDVAAVGGEQRGGYQGQRATEEGGAHLVAEQDARVADRGREALGEVG